MKGLLLKDFINLKKQLKIIVFLIAFYLLFAIFSNSYYMLVSVISIVCVMLPITALSYDEKYRWTSYAIALPISRNKIVLSKYILGLIFIIGSLIINGIMIILLYLLIEDMSILELLLSAYASIFIALIMMSIILPIIFKLGVEKGRMFMLVGIFLPVAIIILLAKIGLEIPKMETIKLLLYVSPIFLLIVFFLSINISQKIYKNKEF